ncbi:MAG: helix-turn-helix domain-containing protein [Planctomycetota bacterium]
MCRDDRKSTPCPRIVLEPPRGLVAAESWQALLSPFASVNFPDGPERFHCRSEVVNVDGLLVSRNHFGECEIVTHANSWRAAEETLLLQLCPEAAVHGELGNASAGRGRGRIALHDWSQPHQMKWSRHESLALMIPRARLPSAALLTQTSSAVVWTRDSTPGRLLSGLLLQAWSDLPTLPAGEGPLLAEAFLGLLDGIVRSEVAGGTDAVLDVPMVRAMRLFIEERLEDADLTAEALANAFGCSRATVYRLFEPEGGVRSYILGRRLSQSFRTLSQVNGARPSIDVVAERWGFRSTRQFRRAFSQRFGVAPTEVTEAVLSRSRDRVDQVDPDQAEQIRLLHSWAGVV